MRRRLTLFSSLALLLALAAYFAWPVIFEEYLHYTKKSELPLSVGDPKRETRYAEDRPIPTALSHARMHGILGADVIRSAVWVGFYFPPDAQAFHWLIGVPERLPLETPPSPQILFGVDRNRNVTRLNPRCFSPIRTPPHQAASDLRIHQLVQNSLPAPDSFYFMEIVNAEDTFAIVRARQDGFDARYRVELMSNRVSALQE